MKTDSTRPRLRRVAAGLCALALAPLARAAGHPFAAPPEAAPAGPAVGSVRVALALALVVACVYGAAWLMRRLRVAGLAGDARLAVVAQVSLGTRERAVLLRTGGRELLVGVAPGNVRLLCELAPEATAGAAPVAADPASTAGGPAAGLGITFRDILRRSLGR
jgi:flagellar protein FliO/FliZ